MKAIILKKRESSRRGFTLVELLIVVIVIAILVSLFFPAVRTSREAARRMSCNNNLRQLGFALQHYHETCSRFPSAMGGTGRSGNENRLSGLVALLPFLEQRQLWDQIAKPSQAEGVNGRAMGPSPWDTTFAPWRQNIAVLNCPSVATSDSPFGTTHYAFCVGDMTESIHNPTSLRGTFACRLVSRESDVTDGKSTTIAMAEIGSKADRWASGQYAVSQSTSMLARPKSCSDLAQGSVFATSIPLSELGRGGRWADGSAGFTLVNTVLPPNSPSCAAGGIDGVDGVYSAASRHDKGCQILMVDGATRYIVDSIDAGDAGRPPIKPSQLGKSPLASPYGVWGALGTANGGETAAVP